MDTFLDALERLAAGENDVDESLATTVDAWRNASDGEVEQIANLLPEVIARGDLDRITPLLVRAIENVALRARNATTPPSEAAILAITDAYRKSLLSGVLR